MMDKIKIASLFSGIGGFELGILQAAEKTNQDIEFVFASEFDPDGNVKYINKQPARQIFKKNFNRWPDGDISKIESSDVPKHDILVGGPPCQGFSSAGKRDGLYGAKGSMFFELIRIVREKQPVLVLIENVKGIIGSGGGWDFARILIELEDAGYWVEWQVLDTAQFLPQRRERVFIIGHLTGPGGRGRKIFPLGEGGQVPDQKEPGVYCLTANYYKGPAQRAARTMILCDSNLGRNFQIRDELIAPVRANTGAGYNNVVCHSTFPRSDRSGQGGSGHLQRNDGFSYCCDTANSIAIEVPEIAKCLTGGGHSGGNHSDITVLKTNNRIRRLTPLEVEKLQGFPVGWTAEGINDLGNIVKISDTQRYRTLGNAVSVPVIKYIFEYIFEVWNYEQKL